MLDRKTVAPIVLTLLAWITGRLMAGVPRIR